jgi:predicted AAA+ superfamily ATPase
MQIMISRALRKIISKCLAGYPAVAILGARQSGKTTLAGTFSDTYFDLELEQEKLRLDLQWDKVLQSKKPIILDEAQHFPEIFPRLRNAIDADRKNFGRFLILGSVSPGLMKTVSDFLTGRIALTELSPLSLLEMPGASQDDLWLMGGFPDGGILKPGQFPQWQNNYLELLAGRDLPAWGLSASPTVTRRLFKMLAAAHGTVWNASMIGKSLGLSYHTVNSYLDHVDQAYLVRRLYPYSANIKKRLVKSPKIYWRDTGLLHSLRNVSNLEEMMSQPWVGLSWEGWVIEQICTTLRNRGENFEPYFFRTSDGYELDLLLKYRAKLWAIEMKLSSSPDRGDMDRLNKVADLVGANKRILISKSKEHIESKDVMMTDLQGFLESGTLLGK